MSKDPNKNNINLIPVGIKWEWDDYRKCLTYKTNITITDKSEKKKVTKDGKIDLRSGAPRIVVQNRQKSAASSTSSSKTEVRKQINSHIKIEDIKNAAIHMLSERYYIPANFERYCNDPSSKEILEEFLLYLANYFYWYFELIDSQIFDNAMCIERSEAELKRTETAEHMLKLTIKAMAKIYCWIILGLDAIEYHHMNCGKNRVSRGYKDRGLFETFYPFCVFFIWITFKRRDYDIIRLEAGRILRSEAFNSSMKVENILEEENKPIESHKDKLKDKQAILSRYEENRIILNDFISKIQNKTSTATLTKRSPVMVSILPSPQESSEWLFNRRGGNIRFNQENDEEDNIELFQEIGILGQPMKLFHIKTLTLRGSNELDEAGDEIKSEVSHDQLSNGVST